MTNKEKKHLKVIIDIVYPEHIRKALYDVCSKMDSAKEAAMWVTSLKKDLILLSKVTPKMVEEAIKQIKNDEKRAKFIKK